VSLNWEQTIIEALDPPTLGRWWLTVLGWKLLNDDPTEFEIRPALNQTPGLLFVPTPDPKRHKNRLHLDFRPDDQQREIERLLKLGARPVDIGQGDTSWRVLTDPEGNEFCVLSSATR
jgi:predicted enzyme related to lactoylglutathione lyase